MGQSGDIDHTEQQHTTTDDTGTLPDTKKTGEIGPKNLPEISTIDPEIFPDATGALLKGDTPEGFA